MLNDFYVLVDIEKKKIIDKIQKLPETWKNISGLSKLSDEELCDLKWAGQTNLGWISLKSNLIQEYYSDSENLELNKNTLKTFISEIRKDRQSEPINYKGIRISTDEKTRYSLIIKKLYSVDEVNYKFFNKYYTFTKEQIIEICDMIEKHIQDCFDWEMKIYQQIESCQKISDFLNIKL